MKFDFNTISQWAGYSGNIQADMMDQDRDTGEKVEDRYLCTECGFKVPEKHWIARRNCCTDCFMDFRNEQGSKYKER